MIPEHTIDYLLNSAFLWYAHDEDFRVETVKFVDDNHVYVEHYVSRADLKKIDPRLPIAFDAMLKYADTAKVKGVPARRNILGLKVQQLRSFWANPSSLVFTTRDLTLHLSGISEVSYRAGQPTVEIAAYGYAVDYIDSELGKIAYYTARFRETFEVSTDWMKSNYPHWEERYEMATTMGYTGHGLAEMVCVTESLVPDVVAEEVTFD